MVWVSIRVMVRVMVMVRVSDVTDHGCLNLEIFNEKVVVLFYNIDK